MTEQTAKQYCGSAAVKSLFLYWLLCTKELDGDAQSMLGNLARGMLKEKKSRSNFVERQHIYTVVNRCYIFFTYLYQILILKEIFSTGRFYGFLINKYNMVCMI